MGAEKITAECLVSLELAGGVFAPIPIVCHRSNLSPCVDTQPGALFLLVSTCQYVGVVLPIG